MKTTKKFGRVAVLIMAVMMVLSFTSCNKKGKNPLKGHQYQCKEDIGKVTLFIFLKRKL